MVAHPFTESTGNKVVSVALSLLSLLVCYGVLVYYGERSWEAGLLDAGVSVGVLLVVGYGLWFMLSFMRVWQAQWVVNILVQCLCHGLSYTALAFGGMEDPEFFIHSLPMRFLLGVQGVNMLMMYYLHYWEKSEWLSRRVEGGGVEEVEACLRISVKEGATIHILKVEDIYCLQAGGDYVTVFTSGGQYLKEQTLKYYEAHLPEYFVRIHRSTIVNTNYIFRVELMGKDTYVVKLKNGVKLKASAGGHRLLRERLGM
jgi:hypothetical protein